MFTAVFEFTGQFQVAQTLCQRPELAKFALAQALLAYSYASQRKYDKAIEVGRAVASTKPTDEGVVNALGCAFKVSKSDADFASLYENALSNPNAVFPEHFHVELFNCYCRMRDFKKMQQQAQKLHRSYQASSNSKYLFWSVTSMLLQADLPSTMMAVAEKMLSKVYHDIDKTRNAGAEELELYLSTLVMQNKYDQAVNELNQITSRRSVVQPLIDEDHFRQNTNKVAKQPEELTNLLLDLNVHTNNVEKLFELAQSILVKHPDQWNVWELLIDKIVFHRSDTSRKESYSGLLCFQKKQAVPATNPAGTEPDEAADFVQLLRLQRWVQTAKTAHPKLRGPALAEIRMFSSLFVLIFRHQEKTRLLQRVFLEIVTPERLEAARTFLQNVPAMEHITTPEHFAEDLSVIHWLTSLLLQYLAQFESKYCCFLDIKPTLYHLQQMRAPLVASAVYTVLLRSSGDRLPAQLNHIRTLLPQKQKSTKEEEGSSVVDTTAAVQSLDVAAGAAETAAAAEEEDDDEDEDDAGDNNATTKDGGDIFSAAAAVAAAANSKAKKNKKKKANKNKKKGAKKGAAVNGPTIVNLSDLPRAEEKKVKEVNVSELRNIVAKDEELLGLLCVAGVHVEVHTYCYYQLVQTEGSSPAPSLAVDLHSLVLFFQEVSAAFADGVGGEQRTIRPADTLLMVASSLCRLSLLQPSASPSSSSIAENNAASWNKYVESFQWAALLQYGISLSPYSYSFKVDLLEVYRHLASGLDALNLFSDKLGVKYIQNDSLSYLLLPTLLENGMFKEAATKYRSIVSFHRSARRETVDNMGRAFEHGNYCKAMEMNQFVEDSRHSLALSLAHVEGRNMDLITNILTVNDLEHFYNMISEESHDDTYRAFDNIDVHKLVNHQDFSLLLDRLEAPPVHSWPFQQDLHAKEDALHARVHTPTLLMQVTYGLLADDADKFTLLTAQDIGSTLLATPLSSAEGRCSQSLEPSRTLGDAQASLVAAVGNIALVYLTQIQPPASATAREFNAEKTHALLVEQFQAFDVALGNISSLLFAAEATFCLPTTTSVEAGDALVLPPQHLRQLWSVVRYSVTWVSLFWQIILRKGYYPASPPVSTDSVIPPAPPSGPVSAEHKLLFKMTVREVDRLAVLPSPGTSLGASAAEKAADEASQLASLVEQDFSYHQMQQEVLRALTTLPSTTASATTDDQAVESKSTLQEQFQTRAVDLLLVAIKRWSLFLGELSFLNHPHFVRTDFC